MLEQKENNLPAWNMLSGSSGDMVSHLIEENTLPA